MNGFYYEKNPEIRDGLWESEVKYWLAVEKGIINPSLAVIKKYSKMIESGQHPDYTKSFCAKTVWKYGQFKPA